jgi:hypothetical protein
MAVQSGDPEAMQLYQIIGAPLLAVVQAEVQAAQVSADFIKRVGFVSAQPQPGGVEAAHTPATGNPLGGDAQALQDGGRIGDLKMAEFAIRRLDPATGTSTPFIISIPVLSLFPIPLLQVKDADFDYMIRILARVPLQSDNDDATLTGAPSKDYLAPDRVELKGLIAPANSGQTSAMNIKVKVRMEQADIPLGLTKLFTLMDQTVAASPQNPPESPK